MTWRRSAVSSGSGAAGARSGDRGCALLDGFKIGDRAQQLAAMAERRNADLFEVLIGQVAEDREIDIVLGKALGVLGHAELFEPVRDLLHRDPSPVESPRGLAAFLDEGNGEFIREILRVLHGLKARLTKVPSSSESGRKQNGPALTNTSCQKRP